MAGVAGGTATAARIGVQVGADVAGGLCAGAGTKMISNAVEKKELTDGVMRQALISGISGGFASGATQGVNMAIGSAVSNGVGRVAI